VRGVPAELRSAAGREFLARLELPAADLERIEVALAMVDSTASSPQSSERCANLRAGSRAAGR
jgi:hypothetical protein